MTDSWGTTTRSTPPAPRPPGLFTTIGIWLVVFLMVWFLIRPSQTGSSLLNPDAEAQPIAPRGDLTPEEQANIKVFRDASPCVVYITSSDLRRLAFSRDILEMPSGSGTGFIYGQDGHIVTNFHVLHPIRPDRRYTVTLHDQSQWEARFVGEAADRDLAVLKIDAPSERLRPIPIGTSHDLLVGQRVYAIGNPFGFDQTLTTGVVSALGREIVSLTGRKIHDVIQTDAAINPGNSGGPLLDSAGRLIGVNTQIASPTGASTGVSFAVPVDIVQRIVPQIIRYGRVIRPGLGVQTLNDQRARQIGIRRGVLILEVNEDSAAQQAGLRGTLINSRGEVRLGDIIVGINGTPVVDGNSLLDALERHQVGEEVRVTVIREDKEVDVTVRLQAL